MYNIYDWSWFEYFESIGEHCWISFCVLQWCVLSFACNICMGIYVCRPYAISSHTEYSQTCCYSNCEQHRHFTPAYVLMKTKSKEKKTEQDRVRVYVLQSFHQSMVRNHSLYFFSMRIDVIQSASAEISNQEHRASSRAHFHTIFFRILYTCTYGSTTFKRILGIHNGGCDSEKGENGRTE